MSHEWEISRPAMTEEQVRDLEARFTARMEASGRRERLEAMVRALVSGDAKMACTSPTYIVKHAEALLAEIDRRAMEEER